MSNVLIFFHSLKGLETTCSTLTARMLAVCAPHPSLISEAVKHGDAGQSSTPPLLIPVINLGIKIHLTAEERPLMPFKFQIIGISSCLQHYINIIVISICHLIVSYSINI